MKLPPLLADRPVAAQVVFAVVIPAAYGALTGYLLGHSKGWYVILSVLAAIGGVGAGFDHLGAAAGAKRGALGGAIFGLAVVIGHAIDAGPATVKIPHPAIALVAFTVFFGVILGALGGYLRAGVEPPAQSA